jgi:transcriptional regulator of acetoin/glycerol metabolism
MSAATTHPPKHWIEDLDADDARVAIVQALDRRGGSVERAADHLGMTRMGLWRHLRDLGMLGVPEEIRDRAARRFRLAG